MSVVVCAACGDERGVTWITAVSPLGLTTGAATRRDVGIGRDGLRDRRQHRRARRAAEVDRQDQRTVGAGPEALGEQVVGAAQRRAGRVVAGVGLAEAQRQHRDREREHDGEAGEQVRDRVARDVVAHARPAVVVAVVVAGAGLDLGLEAGDAEAVDVVAGEADQRGQQRERGDHGDGDDDRGAEAHPRDERDAGDGETADRDDHGVAGDEHRLAGGGDRAARRRRRP